MPAWRLYSLLDERKYHWDGREWHLLPESRPRSDRAVSLRLQAHPEIVGAVATIVAGALEQAGFTLIDRTPTQELCAGGARVHLELKA